MPLQKKEGIQAVRERQSRFSGKGFAAWFEGVLSSIAGIFGAHREETEDVKSNELEESNDRRAFSVRCIVMSDTDNDVNSVKTTLRFAGITNEGDEFSDDLEGVTIFHTGDYVDKKNPDVSVVQYWQSLRQKAVRKGCYVKLIAGNHEQEIWQRMRAGERYGLDLQESQMLNDFIESLDLFHIVGPALLIHGYPTLEFLQTLLHFKEVTGKDPNRFNHDHYKKSFISTNAMRQYAYVKKSQKTNHLLYDVADANRYYRKRGKLVGEILEKLNIGIVVHGHKPRRSGTQADHEFAEWIPNIRMIGNDTNVSRNGLGATVFRVTSRGALDMDFINTKTESDELRSRVRGILCEPFESDAEGLSLDAR